MNIKTDDGDLNFDVEKLPPENPNLRDSELDGKDNSLAQFVHGGSSNAHRISNFEDMKSRNSRRVARLAKSVHSVYGDVDGAGRRGGMVSWISQSIARSRTNLGESVCGGRGQSGIFSVLRASTASNGVPTPPPIDSDEQDETNPGGTNNMPRSSRTSVAALNALNITKHNRTSMFRSNTEEALDEMSQCSRHTKRRSSVVACATPAVVKTLSRNEAQVDETTNEWQGNLSVLEELSAHEMTVLKETNERVAVIMKWIFEGSNRVAQRIITPAPITSRMYTELSRGLEGFTLATNLADIPFPLPWAQLLAIMKWMVVGQKNIFSNSQANVEVRKENVSS